MEIILAGILFSIAVVLIIFLIYKYCFNHAPRGIENEYGFFYTDKEGNILNS